MPSQPLGRTSSSKKRTIWQAIDRHDRSQLAHEPETARRVIMTGSLCIGIDVGGTFTDLFMVDDHTGDTFRHKLSSTPDDPHEAPVHGILEILEKAGRKPQEVRFVGLGTTVATNALLERKGAATGLITTRGFRDLLEICARPVHTFTISPNIDRNPSDPG